MWVAIIVGVVIIVVILIFIVSRGSSDGGFGGGGGGGGGGGVTFLELNDGNGGVRTIDKPPGKITLTYSHSNLLDAINFTVNTFNSILTSIPFDYNFEVKLGIFSNNSAGTYSNNTIRIHESNNQYRFNDGLRNVKDAVLLHEVLHGLGMVQNNYSGDKAKENYRTLIEKTTEAKDGPTVLAENIGYGPPIEDDGGAGTVNSHFEEGRIESLGLTVGANNSNKYIFPNEIMTGVLNSDNYLTIMTLGVLEDLNFGILYESPFVFTNYVSESFKIIRPGE